MARHKITCAGILGTGDCNCGIEERRKAEEEAERKAQESTTIEQEDLDELAKQIQEGFTSGRLDNGEGKHISWELKTEVWKD